MVISRDILKETLGELGALPAGKPEAARRSDADRGGPPADFFVVRIVDALLLRARRSGASELHIEPREKDALVRFRIDGLMHDIVRYPKPMHDLIVARLKTMGRLRTDERFAAQDGRIRASLEGETVDVRLGIVPVSEGEKVVARLLTGRGRRLRLESLGLAERDIEKVRRAAEKPSGMILAVGPAGCGKTTTLYAILETLDARGSDITAIEDPIEYDLPGVSQIRVGAGAGIGSAAGLRAIVRHDPDVIMVGELRDEETAGIAADSAAAGRLVLSTLRVDDAAAALPRLLDMRIDPSSLASSLDLVIAQRLVRKICPECRKSGALSAADAKAAGLPKRLVARLFGQGKSLTVFYGAKCGLCRHTGYLGRLGIFELIAMDESIRDLVKRRAGAEAIGREAALRGMVSMLEDGLDKVLLGQTTLDELLRVMRDRRHAGVLA